VALSAILWLECQVTIALPMASGVVNVSSEPGVAFSFLA
jgi:hypothetical protein